ncbi:recombination protein NinG [Vibrio algivorus]|uniref:Recombination protein NinG n=1 Tax=Vibrio algivorus TaxID=1667024 RepID=A0A557P9M8_9VIBR|nr:recombination protein NinG [Vibrio algivorus]TVO37366.1 recombination protein NinG [Vibrio algivorus]
MRNMKRSYRLEKAQAQFNRFIRLRDAGKPCISCERYIELSQLDAGHYRSIGAAPELRFNEDNCHGQCRECNGFKSANKTEYRGSLIDKIGLKRVEEIEQHHPPANWSIEDIYQIEKEYKAKSDVMESRWEQYYESA